MIKQQQLIEASLGFLRGELSSEGIGFPRKSRLWILGPADSPYVD